MQELMETLKKTDVLVVEDDKSVSDLVSDVLEIEGFGTTIAHDGQEGLNTLLNPSPHKFGLILLDMRMPNMDGTMFLQEIQKYPWISIPVVIMSASEKLDTYLGKDNVVGVVEKPFNLDTFIETVKFHVLTPSPNR